MGQVIDTEVLSKYCAECHERSEWTLPLKTSWIGMRITKHSVKWITMVPRMRWRQKEKWLCGSDLLRNTSSVTLQWSLMVIQKHTKQWSLLSLIVDGWKPTAPFLSWRRVFMVQISACSLEEQEASITHPHRDCTICQDNFWETLGWFIDVTVCSWSDSKSECVLQQFDLESLPKDRILFFDNCGDSSEHGGDAVQLWHEAVCYFSPAHGTWLQPKHTPISLWKGWPKDLSGRCEGSVLSRAVRGGGRDSPQNLAILPYIQKIIEELFSWLVVLYWTYNMKGVKQKL